jgi:hypothetical protein
MGVAACAAAGCHNGNGPRGSKGNEYSTWAAHDSHARAFTVLYEQRSRRMLRNLGLPGPATETALCLRCHAMNSGTTDASPVGERFWVGDGVGCESCHGAAERWLAEHYRWPRELSATDKERLGFKNLRDLGVRAGVCTGCHVGAAGQDVNHDLIAAGHPRLNFEFSAALAIYPRHWQSREDDARAWEVGQAACGAAALRLLSARAANAARPWPEFAEYACSSCHKDLRAGTSRGTTPLEGRPPGSFCWGSWYAAELLPLAAKARIDLDVPGASLADLRTRVQSPGPDRAQVAREAASLATVLQGWATRLASGPALSGGDVRRLMRSLCAEAAKRGDGMSWDEATQAYLALAALQRGWAERAGPPVPATLAQHLRQLRGRLEAAFEPGYDSPRRFDPLARPRLGSLLHSIAETLGQE